MEVMLAMIFVVFQSIDYDKITTLERTQHEQRQQIVDLKTDVMIEHEKVIDMQRWINTHSVKWAAQ